MISSLLLMFDFVTFRILGIRFLIHVPGAPFLFIILSILYVLYINNSYKHILYAITFTVLCTFFDFIMFSIASMFFDINVNMLRYSELYTTISILPSFICIIIVSILFSHLHKSIDLQGIKLSTQLIATIGVFGFGQLVTILTYSAISIGTWHSAMLTILAIFGGLLFFIVIIKYIVVNQALQHSIQLTQFQEKIVDNHMSYVTALSIQDDETRKFRHDITADLRNMYHLLKTEDYSTLRFYMEELNQEISNIIDRTGIETGNTSINHILNGLGIEYDKVRVVWSGVLPNDIALSTRENALLFTNLLSNAFEAAHKVTNDPYVTINVRHIQDSMYLAISNNYLIKPQQVNNELITSKIQKQKHGYGTRIIKDIVQKYNGTVSFQYKDQIFEAEIIIPYYEKTTHG